MKKIYTTIAGDKWDIIAHKTTGNAQNMDLLIKANIKYRHIFIFPAGIKLQIPTIKEEENPKLPPWKREHTP